MSKWSAKEAAIKVLQRGGRLDPNDLVEAAKAPGHPCHGDFTWDIKDAAAKCWRDEARALIRRCQFEILADEVSTPVVSYVSSPDADDDTFTSVPHVRSKSKVSAVLAREVTMLHGVAARVYGIALAKQGIVGAEVVDELCSVRDQLAVIRDEFVE